jgi:hypothetical protein
MRADVQDIFIKTPQNKQVMMFSATLDKDMRGICKKFMNEARPQRLTLSLPPPLHPADGSPAGSQQCRPAHAACSARVGGVAQRAGAHPQLLLGWQRALRPRAGCCAGWAGPAAPCARCPPAPCALGSAGVAAVVPALTYVSG